MKIEIENVTKIINKNVILENVSLSLQSGCITGFKGVNGSGKTMILRTLCGLIKPTEGRVIIDGKVLQEDIEFPESIGILIDNPAFLDNYSAYDNLKFLVSVKSQLSDIDIRNILQEVQLDNAGKKKYKHFSLGMKQRLGIAAAIMEKPDIILLDEPTNALDSNGVEMMKKILIREKKRGALIALTCHDYSILKEVSDEIYFIEEGRVVNFEINETAE